VINLNPLTQIDPIIIVATIVIFLATYFALRRLFIFPYLAVMEERERLFEDADERRYSAGEIERSARQDAQHALDEAARAAEELNAASRVRCDSYQRQCLSEATAQASKILEAGRIEIAAARAKESDGLRDQVQDCVGVACSRLLGDVDSDAVGSAVERAMARRMGEVK